MAEDFDIGPLTWVKDEIDQALKSVLANLDSVAANPDDVTSLKFSETHLYQVSGALDMVGLEGCKRFCAEIENLTGKLEKKSIPATPEVLEILTNAVHALSHYLQDLLNGAADIPLKLAPALNAMVQVQGQSVAESELFYPDTSARAPKDVISRPLEESALPGYVAEQRREYQKSLVKWLKDASQQGLASMAVAIDNVQQVQSHPAQRALWWSAGAFTDALSQAPIAENQSVKRLCRRLDQQLKSISEGAARASSNLLRDLLYYVALSAPNTERISKVKDVFELDHQLPDFARSRSAAENDMTVPEAWSDQMLSLVKQLKQDLKIVEQSLDTYFRNPDQQQVLDAADGPLRQVIAAFDQLNMPLPAAIAKASSAFVEHFRQAWSAPDQSLFELVAESLSMLGFYVEELPRTRPESRLALEQALTALESQLQQLAQTAKLTPPAVTLQPVGIEVAENLTATDSKTDSAIDAEALDIYLTEAEEVLATIAQNLQGLRVNATDQEALAEVRRGFHTLKGSGRTVGLMALGEVAWEAENLVNMTIENRVIPGAAQLGFIEQASAAFAGWIAALRESGSVELNPQQWQQQASALKKTITQQPPVLSEEVLIDGTRKMSRTFFNIFTNEASQHIQTLVQDMKVLSEHIHLPPTEASRRAAHTLVSNAGAAGFKPLVDLARGLEHWLDAHQGHWTPQALTLLENVVATLSEMINKASQLRTPKSASGLLKALKQATLNETSSKSAATIQSSAQQTVKKQSPAESLEQSEASPASPVTMETLDSGAVAAVAAEAEPVVATTVAAEPETMPLVNKSAAKVDQELLTMFLEEARELVPRIGNALRAWRSSPQESDHPDALQRSLHTLKGSARMAGQATLGDTVHGMEDRVMRALKTKVSSLDFDDMFVDLDRIGGLLEEAVGDKVATTVATGEKPMAMPSPGRTTNRRVQYLRLRADVLDRLINEAGEISIARSRMDREMQGFKTYSLDLTESVFRLRGHLRELEIEAESQLQSRMTHLQETNETFDPLEFDRFTRLQELTRMMAESVNDVATIQHGLLMNLDETESALQQQNRMNRELQHGLMDVRMVPFSLVSERLQRIVRQTARELDKRVEMKIDGEGVEMDRSVLDKISAPLEHLLRNAVAHGMETSAERISHGKPELGTVKLTVRQESDEIVLTVTDDGAGINLARVRETALEKGLFAADQEISEQALLSVIFEPGFSTATTVTQVAGRGVGLDAVRSDITALAGRIDVSSTLGKGALFSIYLPVTLSVAQVVMVRAGTRVFALPSVMVEQVQKLKLAPLAEGYAAHHIAWAEHEYPLHFLGRLIGETEHEPEQQRYTPLLLLRSGIYRIALHVDEILGNQEVVMKSIGQQLSRVPGMIGATVTGDGKIVLLLNAVQLAHREVLAVGSIKVSTTVPVEVDDTPVVMVVDDSLTMRKVLGRLLEREGYRVITAKDGMDALQMLQETQPAIMLMDIEMPRMDGFELARNVRNDQRTKDIPIIMISSRTAEKHRNVAKELGVNAFLGKPVQDDELMAQISELLGRSVPLPAA